MATAVSTTSASDVKGQIQILEQPSYMAGHADHRQHTEHSHGKAGWRSTSNDMYGYTYIYIHMCVMWIPLSTVHSHKLSDSYSWACSSQLLAPEGASDAPAPF